MARSVPAAKRKRVLLLSPSFNEPGGAERRARLIAFGLAERGWQVRVIARGSHQRHFHWTRRDNVTIWEVPNFGYSRSGTVLFLTCGVVGGLLWGATSSVLMAMHLYSPLIAVGLCGALLRRPYVAVATTSGEEGEVASLLDPTGPKRGAWSGTAYRVERRIRRLLLQRATLTLAQTDGAVDELAGIVPRARVRLLPSAVERVEPFPLTGVPRALFLGRYRRDKDLLRLLGAWREVLTRVPEARLTLLGGGGAPEADYDVELRAAVAGDPQLRATVDVGDWVDDVSGPLAAHDVFVFPSLKEGMSNALLEACACGRVVVASDIAANRFVLGDDYPLLYEAGQTTPLASALVRAFRDESTRALSSAAALRRASTFSLRRVMDGLDEELRAVSGA